ncbi:hypothetical protein SPBR_01680 [Sporothrix brasiliensis 5110]|uniref:Aminoglycoside phosphotransferase domain-containing protein n=1 Tax=Sporothrix brasiliensis 5110 TaxID=1398154 RepID=A0A0C2IZ40_9PEZI|nr:uncharacterized protein SPBR_01680 [Sporothrix brasiliensis 5110]KIH91990.1 hypothetical protein SPBR_01680 [Sporothrix brasiliensis 5110]
MPAKKTLTISAETKAWIHDILQSEFSRQVESVELQLGSNNTQVYTVTIAPGSNVRTNNTSTRTARSTYGVQMERVPQPGTETLPADTTTVILRFTDAGADLNDTVQVQNEVAAYSLARVALASLDEPVTPRIYGWRSVNLDTKVSGWILQERKRGVGLNDEVFKKLDRAAKNSVLTDIARIFHLLQQYKLPVSVVGYGGLNFDDDGRVITGPTTIHGATKACATYRELCYQYLRTQIQRMDMCDVVQGWQDAPDLRARIDAFVERGFQPLLERSIEANPRPNFLYDPQTSRITALVDWSFSHVASLYDEYFYSFPELFHIVTPEDPTSPSNAIRRALLHGLVSVSDEDKAGVPMADWTLIEQTNAAFVVEGVIRPVDLMPGIDTLSDLYWFIQNLSPGMFYMSRVRAKMGPQRIQAVKRNAKDSLEQTLKRWEY